MTTSLEMNKIYNKSKQIQNKKRDNDYIGW